MDPVVLPENSALLYRSGFLINNSCRERILIVTQSDFQCLPPPTDTFVTLVQTTGPLSPQPRSLWPSPGPQAEPSVHGCVGLLVIGSHGILDGDSTMPHSMSPLYFVKGSPPQPDNEPERHRALPGVEWEMSRCSPWNRLTPPPLLSNYLPNQERVNCTSLTLEFVSNFLLLSRIPTFLL